MVQIQQKDCRVSAAVTDVIAQQLRFGKCRWRSLKARTFHSREDGRCNPQVRTPALRASCLLERKR